MYRRCRTLWLGAMLLAAGCWSARPSYDPQQAQATLVLALDAWKQGDTAALARREVSIRFEDDDHRNGWLLTDYRLELGRRPLRPFDDARVTLWLRDRRGKKLERTAVYQVTLEPKLAVLRND